MKTFALNFHPPWQSLYVGLIFLLAAPGILFAGDGRSAEALIQSNCVNCHKFQGNAESRFNLIGPDLMWGGSKFQRNWLLGWLTGKEPTMYEKSYRWDQSQEPQPHPTVSQKDAEMLADYFEQRLIDPSTQTGVLDLSTFSEHEATFGEQIFEEHSCISCHQIEKDGKKIGGSQSTSFVDAGKRLKADWIYRFNFHPPDFTPNSGEFVADVSELELRYVSGFIATRGIPDFPFYQPWKSQEFAQASFERGAQIYKEYCAQCHGFAGQGDGPAAPVSADELARLFAADL